MQATYDLHEYVDEKREALERWASYLAQLRDGQLHAQKKAPNRAPVRRLLKHEHRQAPFG
jgi:hypothetical protein